MGRQEGKEERGGGGRAEQGLFEIELLLLTWPVFFGRGADTPQTSEHAEIGTGYCDMRR